MKKIFLFLLFVIIFSGCQSKDFENNVIIYSSEQECIDSSNCTCSFAMCDYVPEGKTFEEACGENFQKGWQCID